MTHWDCISVKDDSKKAENLENYKHQRSQVFVGKCNMSSVITWENHTNTNIHIQTNIHTHYPSPKTSQIAWIAIIRCPTCLYECVRAHVCVCVCYGGLPSSSRCWHSKLILRGLREWMSLIHTLTHTHTRIYTHAHSRGRREHWRSRTHTEIELQPN